MPVLTNIGLLAACRLDGGQAAVHTIAHAALVWERDLIVWVGPEADLPSRYADEAVVDAEGRLVMPGLVDCHTHLAFAGWRADEFEQRLRGRTYLEIAAAGGGIARTTVETRAAPTEDLVGRCRSWLQAMMQLGITTIEAKSGYGLDVVHELRLLDIYRQLNERQPVRIVPTLLAAHVVPLEYRDRRDEYVALVRDTLIPEAAKRGLARFCDVFLEESAFNAREARLMLKAAAEHGLRAKIHADQLTDGGGAELAAELNAVSADHLECVSASGIAALVRSEIVAVSLPVASLFLGRPPLPARRLIDAGVAVAVATDFNPGTAPTFHLPLALLLACTLQRMTPAEALKGATIYAAKAIGEHAVAGSLEPGKRADFIVVDALDVNHWIYHFSENRCVSTYIGGARVN